MIFYFAWADANEVFGPEHLVQDEQIAAFNLTHEEGGFAKLTVQVRNPNIGPLSASRQFWAWFSYQENDSSDVVPLFFGRIVGIPSNILGEVITYELIARPVDYPELKASLANTLRVLPFFDPIFISGDMMDDPDVVLEGYSALFHIGRITHEVSISDVLVGEDGVVEFSPADIPYDSLEISMARLPLSAVTVKGGVPWTQRGSGEVQIGPIDMVSADSAAMAEGWPKVGDSLAGGYKVLASSTFGIHPPGTMHYDYSYTNRKEKHRDGDTLTLKESYNCPVGRSPVGRFAQFGTVISEEVETTPADKETGTPYSFSTQIQFLDIAQLPFRGSLTLGADTSTGRRDNVELTVSSGLQPVLRDPEDTNDTEIIQLNADDASKEECLTFVAVEALSDNPSDHISDITASAIDDESRSEYISTDRGLQSLGYMVARARARLLLSARAVDIKFNCRFSVVAELSCRMNGYIVDPRIPGGEALGKIVEYSLQGDGNSGLFIGSVTMSCAVGLGDAITVSDGTADYVDVDYVDDYQTFTGQITALPSGDIGYSPPTLVAGGGSGLRPGIVSAGFKSELPDEEQGDNDINVKIDITIAPEQRGEAHYNYVNEYAAKNAQRLAAIQEWYEVELVDLNQEGIEAHWAVTTTPLSIPRQIDLTAEPTP